MTEPYPGIPKGAAPAASTAREAKGKIGVLIEEHFDATEYREFNIFFPAWGYDVQYISHLWGNKELTFGSNPEDNKIEFHVPVTTEIDSVHPSDYKGILLIGAYAMDRLRYEANPRKGQPNQSPAVNFLRKAIDTPGLKIGTICHSLWLFCAAPELLKGRKVTCAHNLIYDVQNAGGDVQFGKDGTIEVFVDGNLITGKHPGFTHQFLETFLKEMEGT
jgi:protease I